MAGMDITGSLGVEMSQAAAEGVEGAVSDLQKPGSSPSRGLSAGTKVGGMDELKRKFPEIYNLLVSASVTQFSQGQKASQERVKEIRKEAERSNS